MRLALLQLIKRGLCQRERGGTNERLEDTRSRRGRNRPL
jgi:hypothetical protein